MQVLLLTFTLHAPWLHSLKQKRSIVKSLVSKLHNRFNISAAESHSQDIHQSIGISVAVLAANPAQADSMAENITHFIEASTDAELIATQKELL